MGRGCLAAGGQAGVPGHRGHRAGCFLCEDDTGAAPPAPRSDRMRVGEVQQLGACLWEPAVGVRGSRGQGPRCVGPLLCHPRLPGSPSPPAALLRPKPSPGAALPRQQRAPFSAAPARSNKAALLFLPVLKYKAKQIARACAHASPQPLGGLSAGSSPCPALTQPCAPSVPRREAVPAVTLPAAERGRRRGAGVLPEPLAACPWLGAAGTGSEPGSARRAG